MSVPIRVALTLGLSLLAGSHCCAQVDPASGINFVTIGRPGNAPYSGTQLGYPYPQVTGRGSVNYSYRLGREEISTAQWAEFVNTFSMQTTTPTTLFGLAFFTRAVPIWGAGVDPDYHGPGRRWIYQNSQGSNALDPVFGISWRDAAMYCNWLHNGKSSDLASLLTGAYDTSTWNSFPTRPYTDSFTHESGARYWIPTLDEWLKAAFYDPNRNGPGQEGWWNALNASDQLPVSGLPGTPGATTSALLQHGPGTQDVYSIDLGAYPTALSPWGLLDTASGAIEHTEAAYISGSSLAFRYAAGLGAGDQSLLHATPQYMATIEPADRLGASFRIAASVPAPTTGLICVLGLPSVLSSGFLRRRRLALTLGLSLVAGSHCCAQVDPASGIDFVTIGHPGNAPYTGPQNGYPYPQVTGRGRVNYSYKLGREEVSTAQWAEFVNTFSVQTSVPNIMFGQSSFKLGPVYWGAGVDPDYHGPGRHWIYQNDLGTNAQNPIFGINWRDAAMYCNWLHNGKSLALSSLLQGAYDTSTWNNFPTSPYTDSLTHEPGARYWIPTLDEWIKGTFYDPNRNGPGQEGWWNYLNSSDQLPLAGLPGVPGATTSATLLHGPGTLDVYSINLGTYPTALSPWGLLDTASGGIEFNEEAHVFNGGVAFRYAGGLGAGDGSLANASFRYMDTLQPADRFYASVRIATSVPAPTTGLICVLGLPSVLFSGFLRRRRLALTLGLSLVAGSRCVAQVDPASGIDFVTIGHPGNAPYSGTQLGYPYPQVTGRGGVNYSYRIGREEVSTAQWAEFVNTFSVQKGVCLFRFFLSPCDDSAGYVGATTLNTAAIRVRCSRSRETS